MAGYIHCVSFRTPTGYLTTGGGAADSSFPHANAADITSPHWPWKSSANAASGTTFYGVDFGSAVELAGVGIDNINLSAVKLQAASSDDFASNLITTDLTIGPNLVERSLFSDANGVSLGRHKHFLAFAGTDFAGASRRYWRVLANTSTSITGSAAKMWVGSVAWCRTLDTWAMGSSGYDELPIEATILNDDAVGGGARPVIAGNPHGAITLSSAGADLDTMRASLLSLLREGPGRPVLFARNNGDAADWYICHRASESALSQRTWTTVEFDRLILRSAV